MPRRDLKALFGWALIAAAALAAVPREVVAQDYPARPVTILVPFAPGGGTDILARAVAQRLEQRLGKPFVIENRVGAGTVLAAGAAAKAAPDGYTLMQATSGTLAMNGAIFKSLPYDPAKDLVPVALVAAVPFVLLVNADLPVRSVADLVKLAKEKPLSYGSGGPGAFHHLNAELFSSMTGIKMSHVPYRGSAPALIDLVAGHIQILFTDLAPAIDLVRANKVRVLGITTAEPAAAAPDIPPLAKAGVPGYDTAAWQMLVAPAKTPRPVLEKLNAAVNASVQTADLQKQFIDLGLIPIGKGSLEELEAYTRSEVTRWSKVIQDAGIAGTQ
ncbi:MAG: tripartite tricarboxylate transporter substrate binding protein [Xanthobacteraceae bacterium]|nr:tripartite tricarboxylate transporter substrate binding protein [Xanthobacteraceae bacterium]